MRAAEPALMSTSRNGREVLNAQRTDPSDWVKWTVRRSSGPAVSAGSTSAVVGGFELVATVAAFAAIPARACTVAAPSASNSPQKTITTPLSTGGV